MMTIQVNDEDAHMITLALWKLAEQRPGWLLAIRLTAQRIKLEELFNVYVDINTAVTMAAIRGEIDYDPRIPDSKA